MTKQEFLNAFGTKLREGMTSSEILSQVRYYEGYIDGEIAKGKTEEEAVADLGDPILIARNILESPREEEFSIFGNSVQDQEDAYEEGSYQGENQHSEEEVRQAVKEDVPLGETAGRKTAASEDRADKKRTEEVREQAETKKHSEENRNSSEYRKSEEKDEDPYNGSIPIHGGDEEEDERKESAPHMHDAGERYDAEEDSREEAESGTGLFHDEHGRFRWDLFGVILAFVIGLTAVIWLVTKIVTAMSPVAIIVILIIIAVFLVIHFRS